MSFEHFPGIGTVHLNTVKPRKQAPAGTRHQWSTPHHRAGTTIKCRKCGCLKISRRDPFTRHFNIFYRPAGSQLETDMRPPCTGKTSSQPA